MKIVKGKAVTVRTAFKRRGIALTFANPPIWRLYNGAGKVLLQGVAAADGSRWAASFTIPTSYVVPDGSEDLEVEFIGVSGNNEYARSKEIELADEGENFRTSSLVYNTMVSTPLRDSIVVPYDELEYIIVNINTPYNTAMYTHPTIVSPAFKTKTSRGYEYAFDVGSPDLNLAFKYLEPVQLVVQYKAPGMDPEVEIHPVYVLNGANANLVNSLQQYLDKARLTEIDPTLQWSTDELLHYLNEGVGYINAFGDPATYWTAGAYPASLRTLVIYAAAWHGLNARYLAEGFNSFEFAGLNTQLTFNRTDFINTKMSELQGVLDARIPAARAAAVRAYGIGIAPADSGQISNAATNSGVLAIGLGPNTNSYGYRNRNRLLRRI